MNALYIENVKDEFLPTFKELAKALNAKMSVTSTTQTADKAQDTAKQDFINSVKKDIESYEKGELNCISADECEREMQGFMQDLAKKYAR